MPSPATMVVEQMATGGSDSKLELLAHAAPRSVIPRSMRMLCGYWSLNCPELSATTSLEGQPAIALAMLLPSPGDEPVAVTVVQTVPRVGMPPMDARPAFCQLVWTKLTAGMIGDPPPIV